MKPLKALLSFWGDITFAFLFTVCLYIVGEHWITWYINEPLAIALFVASSLYFVFAVVRFVILRKKRALRDWIYPFYGFSLAAGMLLFILSEEVITNLIEFDVLAHNFLVIAWHAIIVLALVRFILWLGKKHKNKAAKRRDNNMLAENERKSQ